MSYSLCRAQPFSLLPKGLAAIVVAGVIASAPAEAQENDRKTVSSKECELTVELRNGERRTVDFFGMTGDSLDISGRTETGAPISLRLPKQVLVEATFTDGTPLDLSLSEGRCADGSEEEEKELPSPDTEAHLSEAVKTKGTVRITSSEEGIPIWIDDRESGYTTPATLTLDTGLQIVELRWSVEHNLWAAQKQLNIFPGQQLSLHLPLKRALPALSVRSEPTHAELWLQAHPDFALPARWRTPFHKGPLPPGQYNITLRADGFRDTTLVQHLFVDHPTPLYVELTPLSPAEHLVQQQQRSRRNRNLFGRSLIWGAVPPLLSAVLLFAAADADFSEAHSLRKNLEGAVMSRGENFRRIRIENRELVRHGDRKRAAGWVALSAGGVLLLTGAALQIDF